LRSAHLYTHSTAGESPFATLGCAISLPLVCQKSTDMAARAHRAQSYRDDSDALLVLSPIAPLDAVQAS